MTTPILARPTDPGTSDAAAEKQAWKLTASHHAILAIFQEKKAGLTDTELNKFYKRIWVKREFPQLAFDTPRRRRSDLAGRKFLADCGKKRRNDNGEPEVVWILATPSDDAQLAFDFDSAAA
ncbi:hypothetical protein E3T49_13110 [Cryobacterium cryoconiti]|uniref:Uncharacterized protein n=2 Tax=Cryobacterium cryoconiti TaxID=1259239 RepID=A0A4Y8JU09_9MICO|nr:hypothetical protein E3T49_13110 [Cryobacterium cryoconiti]